MNQRPVIDHDAAWIAGADRERDLPADLRPWLTERGLLSDRVNAATAGAARFLLLGESTIVLDAGARRCLGVADAEAHERRGEFRLDGECLIATQSLFPRTTLARHPWLVEIGGALLGERLKSVARVDRDAFEFVALAIDHPLSWPRQAASARHEVPRCAWARRAVQRIDGAPILVTEVFSPRVAQWAATPACAIAGR